MSIRQRSFFGRRGDVSGGIAAKGVLFFSIGCRACFSQPFQESSQKFTIFKIASQLSSQPFSVLVSFCSHNSADSHDRYTIHTRYIYDRYTIHYAIFMLSSHCIDPHFLDTFIHYCSIKVIHCVWILLIVSLVC